MKAKFTAIVEFECEVPSAADFEELDKMKEYVKGALETKNNCSKVKIRSATLTPSSGMKISG